MPLDIPSHCPGCGVKLQQEYPDAPGYFQIPKKLLEASEAEELDEDKGESEGPGAESEGGLPIAEDKTDATMEILNELVDEWLPRKRPALDIRQYGDQEDDSPAASIRCARCFALQHQGRVKNVKAETALPPFDFAKQVGRKIALTRYRRRLLVAVIDIADFEGSLQPDVLRSILEYQPRPGELERAEVAFEDEDDGRSRRGGRREAYPGFGVGRYGDEPSSRRDGAGEVSFIVVANKADLLPSSLSRTHLEAWVRGRLAAAGLPRPQAVAVASSVRGWGVPPLLARLQRGAGPRGDVYVVGTQNAGKSSLINAMRGVAGLTGRHDVTAAHVPGTTLGMLRVPGLLPLGSKLLDTPGMEPTGSMAAFLTPQELKMLQPRRPLKPRSFRIGREHSVLLGGLARIDVLGQEKGATIYLTCWISDEVVCHMGKTEGVEERREKHLGERLVPPLHSHAASFPQLEPHDITVSGDDWTRSSTDLAISGLGWVGVGVSGSASLRVWVPPGVGLTLRPPLAREFSKKMERKGFGSALGEAATAPKRTQASRSKRDRPQATGGAGAGASEPAP